MRGRLYISTVAITAGLIAQLGAAAAQPRIPQEALKIVEAQFPVICPPTPTTRTTEGYELTGSARVGLNSTISKLADAGFEGKGKYSSQKASGVAEKDLASAMGQERDCHLAVLKFFGVYLLPPPAPKAAHLKTLATQPVRASAPGPTYLITEGPVTPARSSGLDQRIGPVAIMNMVNAADGIVKHLAAADGPKGIFFSNTNDNREVARDLYNIFNMGEQQARPTIGPGAKVVIVLPLFMYTNPDVDFPKPSTSNSPGIIIHGGAEFANEIQQAIGACFNVRLASKPNNEVDTYFKRKLVWVEIGPGSPWLDRHACDE